MSFYNRFKGFKVLGLSGIATVAGCYGIWCLQGYRLKLNIDNAIKKGTRPFIPKLLSEEFTRKDVINQIRTKFIERRPGTFYFGVIIGPPGTGKSVATRQACNENPTTGVLYLEIHNPNDFSKSLVNLIGMRTWPTFLDALHGKLMGTNPRYYQLPENESAAVSYVLTELATRARVSGCPVVLFIDGVDLLAKYKPKVFNQLVIQAKFQATENSLRIVFVCSEGHVMPLLNKMSAKTRSEVLEVLDIDDDKAVKYLKERGIEDENIVKYIVNSIGGRFVYLNRAIRAHETFRPVEMDDFERELHTGVLGGAFGEVGKCEKELLKKLILQDPYNPVEWSIDMRDEVKARKGEAVVTLVKANILRYDRKGFLTWHNRCAKKEAIALFKTG